MAIAGLILVAFYFGMRWNDARLENGELRAQVAMLKRQLARRN